MSYDSATHSQALSGFYRVLRPIARFLIRIGIGYREFSVVCKAAFVSVATEEFGVGGRPTNISRVAAMTGISRKEVTKLREFICASEDDREWSQRLNPPSEILHYWHTDPDFSYPDGQPRTLAFSGPPPSFCDLVRRYAGDLPAGALRYELRRAGAVEENENGLLRPVKNWFAPISIDPKFLRSMSFSLRNLAETLALNADLASRGELEGPNGRLERYVWTGAISDQDAAEFKGLAQYRARALVDELDRWIGEREQGWIRKSKDTASSAELRAVSCGLGVYYFEERNSGKVG